jgi:hypothetical protein
MHPDKIPIIGGALGWLEGEDIDYGLIAMIVGIIVIFLVVKTVGVPESKMITFIFALSPLWLPYVTFHLFFEKWMEMVGKKFFIKSGRAILEIKLPPDVFKSPEAMEFVFTQIYNAATPDNLMETYLDGKRPISYTFELVSRGGDVHFYATIPEKNVAGFNDNIYAQYPGVEVVRQSVDYAAELPGDLKGWSFMSFWFNKKEDEEFPIKTYIDFGMDKLPKEEFKVDPMTPMLEMLAGIKPNQQLWIQFICVAHRKKSFKNGQLHAEGTWEKRVMAKVDEIMGRDKDKKGGIELEGMVRLSSGERDALDAMERNAGKYAYHFACRVCYISNKEGDYDGGLFSRMIRSFAMTESKSKGRNGLGARWRTDFNYKLFSDPFGKRIPAMKKEELAYYKLRKFFGEYKIMSAEEMATIFHLPGKVALTPTLNRVPSTRGEAPSNLPTGNLPI